MSTKLTSAAAVKELETILVTFQKDGTDLRKETFQTKRLDAFKEIITRYNKAKKAKGVPIEKVYENLRDEAHKTLSLGEPQEVAFPRLTSDHLDSLLKDVEALRNQIPSLTLDTDSLSISWIDGPIILSNQEWVKSHREDYECTEDLGLFKITVNLWGFSTEGEQRNSYGEVIRRITLSEGALSVVPASRQLKGLSGYYHPHISGGPCLGEALGPLAVAAKTGNLCQVVDVMAGWLRSYNPGTSYSTLQDFSHAPCPLCRKWFMARGSERCGRCGRRSCPTCLDKGVACSHCKGPIRQHCCGIGSSKTCKDCKDQICGTCCRTLDRRRDTAGANGVPLVGPEYDALISCGCCGTRFAVCPKHAGSTERWTRFGGHRYCKSCKAQGVRTRRNSVQCKALFTLIKKRAEEAIELYEQEQPHNQSIDDLKNSQWGQAALRLKAFIPEGGCTCEGCGTQWFHTTWGLPTKASINRQLYPETKVRKAEFKHQWESWVTSKDPGVLADAVRSLQDAVLNSPWVSGSSRDGKDKATSK